MVGFVINYQIPYLIPTTVDHDGLDSNPSDIVPRLWHNFLLLLGFGFQHTYVGSVHSATITYSKGIVVATYVHNFSLPQYLAWPHFSTAPFHN